MSSIRDSGCCHCSALAHRDMAVLYVFILAVSFALCILSSIDKACIQWPPRLHDTTTLSKSTASGNTPVSLMSFNSKRAGLRCPSLEHALAATIKSPFFVGTPALRILRTKENACSHWLVLSQVAMAAAKVKTSAVKDFWPMLSSIYKAPSQSLRSVHALIAATIASLCSLPSLDLDCKSSSKSLTSKGSRAVRRRWICFALSRRAPRPAP
mmetsp:Transcript_90086/g.172636  ORF Transcript_90086/g.172636 Transcript_90086/m.172636 type:complete len:211 (-) Transcript_90086:36-668(-)